MPYDIVHAGPANILCLINDETAEFIDITNLLSENLFSRLKSLSTTKIFAEHLMLCYKNKEDITLSKLLEDENIDGNTLNDNRLVIDILKDEHRYIVGDPIEFLAYKANDTIKVEELKLQYLEILTDKEFNISSSFLELEQISYEIMKIAYSTDIQYCINLCKEMAIISSVLESCYTRASESTSHDFYSNESEHDSVYDSNHEFLF